VRGTLHELRARRLPLTRRAFRASASPRERGEASRLAARVDILATPFARALLHHPPSRNSRGRREGRVAACTRGSRAKDLRKERENLGYRR